MAKKIIVTHESKTGRNTRFRVPGQGEISRRELAQQIRNGDHPDYHVRVLNGLATPVSNPDRSKGNNLD